MVAAEELARRVRLLAGVLRSAREPNPTGGVVEDVWPRQAARAAVKMINARGRLELSYGERARVAEAFGVPGWALQVSNSEWAFVERDVSVVAALRRHDHRWIITLSGVTPGQSATGAGSHEALRRARVELGRSPRCWRTDWSPSDSGVDASMLARRRDGALLRRCEKVIRDLDDMIGSPGESLQEYVQRLSSCRGRPILLRSFRFSDIPEGECGLFIMRDDRDEIGYPLDAPHASHIVFHEIGHMIRGHRRSESAAASPLARSMARLDPNMIRSVLGRDVYSEEVEREAEIIASLLSSRLAASQQIRTCSDDVTDPVTLRVRGTFGG